jgi:hypothetical protein
VTALLENANQELQTPGIQFLTRTGEADGSLGFRAGTGQGTAKSSTPGYA